MNVEHTRLFHQITTPCETHDFIDKSSKSLCFTVCWFFQHIKDANDAPRLEFIRENLKNKEFKHLLTQSNNDSNGSTDLLESFRSFIFFNKHPFSRDIKKKNHLLLDQLITLQEIVQTPFAKEKKEALLTDFFREKEHQTLIGYVHDLCNDFNLPTMADILDTKLFYKEVLEKIEATCINEYIASCKTIYKALEPKDTSHYCLEEDFLASPEPEPQEPKDANLDQKINLQLAMTMKRLSRHIPCSLTTILDTPRSFVYPDEFCQLIHMLVLVAQQKDMSVLIRENQDEMLAKNTLMPEIPPDSLLMIHAMDSENKSVFLQCLIMSICKNKCAILEESAKSSSNIEEDLRKIESLTFMYKTLVDNCFPSKLVEMVTNYLFLYIDDILSKNDKYSYNQFKISWLENKWQKFGEKLFLIQAFLDYHFSIDSKIRKPKQVKQPNRQPLGCCVPAPREDDGVSLKVRKQRSTAPDERYRKITSEFLEKRDKACLELHKNDSSAC